MAPENAARRNVKLPMSWFRQILVLSIMYVIVVNKILRGMLAIPIDLLWFPHID